MQSREDMTALSAETDAAERECVELRTQLQPLALQGGTPGGLRVVATEPGEPDGTGRSRPVPVSGSETLIEADQVIVAVGQSIDSSFLDPAATSLETDGDGGLRVDPETARTSHPRIFAGGDVVPGPRTVTDAIAWGQRAAWGIDVELRGREAADRKAPPPRSEGWPAPPGGRHGGAGLTVFPGRQKPAELLPEHAALGFDEVIGALTEAQARTEASRCAACGQCGNCRACLDLFGCPAFYLENGLVHIDPALCNGCGVCAHFCPNSAIRPVDRTMQ
jgi:NADPH-dependent glutamate synthase beta subunit-like oxidoreductase